MYYKSLLLFICFGLLFNVAHAEEKYTITGDVSFQYDGDIYICLCTKEEWREFLIPGHELAQPPCKFIKMNSDLKKAGKVSFKLDNIPKGIYVIVTYQDVNKNKKVDYENYLMNEPWGTYKEGDPAATMPSWDLRKFTLEKDIEGIKIQM